jgi:hypothetical protein
MDEPVALSRLRRMVSTLFNEQERRSMSRYLHQQQETALDANLRAGLRAVGAVIEAHEPVRPEYIQTLVGMNFAKGMNGTLALLGLPVEVPTLDVEADVRDAAGKDPE